MPQSDPPPGDGPPPRNSSRLPEVGRPPRPFRRIHSAAGDAPPRPPAKPSVVAAIRDAITLLLAILGGGLALYQFWFVNVYQESLLPPEITLTAGLQEVGRQNGFRALQASITMHNASKTRVYALASWFNVVGSRIAADRMTDRDYHDYVRGNAPRLADAPGAVTSLPRDWHEAAEQSRLINCGKFLHGSYWFEPDEDYTTHFLVYVPDAPRYDQVRLEADTTITKDKDQARTSLQADPSGALAAQVQIRAPGSDRWTTLDPSIDLSTKKQAVRYSVSEADCEYELSLWGSAPPVSRSKP